MPRRPLPQFSPPAHEPSLPRETRRATGVYYTPPEIVQRIVELTLGPLYGQCGPLAPRVDKAVPIGRPLRILDPACGAGEFLVSAQQFLAESSGDLAGRTSLLGIDIDEAAVSVARGRLQTIDSPAFLTQVIAADALSAGSQAAEVLEPASFDAILGNPPYVNIRQLAKALPRERIDALRERYQTARGNFDLYVLFIERALELLRPGGRCGLIIPNKWATLDYARPCRELLLAQATIEHVIDLSDVRAFAQASVYPQIVVFRKTPAPLSHVIRFQSGQALTRRVSVLACSASGTSEGACSTVPQQSLSAAAFAFQPSLDVESRVPTAPLSQLATLSCGTAGFVAQRIAHRLLNAGEESGGRGSRRAAAANDAHLADFITSGNIDRYAIRLGKIRYLNRTYTMPRLPLDSPELTAAKRRLFASPKIVIAGLSRRIEAAWDNRGLALGVQVYAASDCQVDPFYLLALFNSKLLSYLFATRFAAKRLAGGYLAINKGQLAQLPIVALPLAGTKPGSGAPPTTAGRLAKLARRMALQPAERLEPQIDRLVYDLYQLTTAEIARVEAHFTDRHLRAA